MSLSRSGRNSWPDDRRKSQRSTRLPLRRPLPLPGTAEHARRRPVTSGAAVLLCRFRRGLPASPAGPRDLTLELDPPGIWVADRAGHLGAPHLKGRGVLQASSQYAGIAQEAIALGAIER